MDVSRDKSRGLKPPVDELAEDFVLEDGRVRMPPDAFGDWLDELLTLPPVKQAAIATEIVALASKFHRIGGAGAAVAVLQLATLAAQLLQSRREAEEAFAEAGIDLVQAQKLIGREAGTNPGSAPSAPEPGGGASLRGGVRPTKM